MKAFITGITGQDGLYLSEYLLSIGYEAIYVGSSWENGSRVIENKGYSHLDIIQTDGVERRIYSKINNEDLISLITKEGGLRTVLLKA